MSTVCLKSRRIMRMFRKRKQMGEEVEGLPEFLSDKGQRELPCSVLPRAVVDQMAKGKGLAKD